jgi:ADP-ribose pyrophosphatase YjhB (NUDIX family)
MLKISINEVPLILCDVETSKNYLNDKKTLRGRFLNLKTIHSYIDMMEKPHQFDQVVLFSEDFKKLKKDFLNFFKIIKAAGGVVKNEKNEILFIFRRGFWDLPKGKIEKDEKKKVAAVREVQEETGIKNIELISKIENTFHTYTMNNKRILKKTYWYNMKSTDTDLIPQTEEDIEMAVWMSKEKFFSEKRNVYQSIVEVLENAN